MGSLLFRNATVVARDSLLPGHSVLCEGGRIVRVSPDGASTEWLADETVDAGGAYLAPGFIDLHFHGARNLLVDNGRAQLEELCRILPEYGVTAFLPTVCPKPAEEDDIRHLRDLSGTDSTGTAILGFMLEGHFLALTGAIATIPKNHSLQRLEQLLAAVGNHKAVFAVSPEIDGIADLIKRMSADGSQVFLTHTAATAGQTESAIEAGAAHATHFYDVFPYPGEKEPGVRGCGTVEAIMANPNVSVDFVLDGEHVDPIAVKMALTCKGPDKVCLITDANSNAGLPAGSYEGIGGDPIEVAYEGGPARLAKDSRFPGALAGSGLTMDRAVRNAVGMLGINLPQAVAMASANPATVLGLQSNKGFIREGYDADLVMLDGQLAVTGCWIGGKDNLTGRRKDMGGNKI
jgi:N-acetylglucosamine-6-phosphate deacetylase